MSGSWPARIRVTLIVSAGLAAGPALGSATDALAAVQALREGGCGGIVPAARPLRHELALDVVAQQWADGLALAAAAERGGYPALATSGLHVSSTQAGIGVQTRRCVTPPPAMSHWYSVPKCRACRMLSLLVVRSSPPFRPIPTIARSTSRRPCRLLHTNCASRRKAIVSGLRRHSNRRRRTRSHNCSPMESGH